MPRSRSGWQSYAPTLAPPRATTAGAGDPDLYKFFCQRYRELLRDGGSTRASCCRGQSSLPRVRRTSASWLFEEAAPERIDFLVNNRSWAFDTHPQYTVALLPPSDALHRPKSLSKSPVSPPPQTEFVAAVAVAEGLRICSGQPRAGPGGSTAAEPGSAPTCWPSSARADHFRYGGGQWRCFPVAEFHETNDANLWKDATEGWPLWKGERFDQFDLMAPSARLCPPSDEALAKARKPRPGKVRCSPMMSRLPQRAAAVERTVGAARVAFRDVTNRDRFTDGQCLPDSAGALPRRTRPPIWPSSTTTRAPEAACLALMNSLSFDWQARRFVETHLNFFVLEG